MRATGRLALGPRLLRPLRPSLIPLQPPHIEIIYAARLVVLLHVVPAVIECKDAAVGLWRHKRLRPERLIVTQPDTQKFLGRLPAAAAPLTLQLKGPRQATRDAGDIISFLLERLRPFSPKSDPIPLRLSCRQRPLKLPQLLELT